MTPNRGECRHSLTNHVSKKDHEFSANHYRALIPSLAASRRTAPRPGGSPESVNHTAVISEDLQLIYQVQSEQINNSYCDVGLVGHSSQSWPRIKVFSK